MELKVDFNQVPKSKNRYYLGFVMLIFSLILFIYSIYTLNFFFISYFFFFSIMSFSHIYESSGKSINSLFGERFLQVNEEKVEFKEKSRKQSKTIYWDNIESIKFATTMILIKSKEDSKIEIEYGKLSYTTVQQLKETLSTLGKGKKVL
jgi:hypothetical protein